MKTPFGPIRMGQTCLRPAPEPTLRGSNKKKIFTTENTEITEKEEGGRGRADSLCVLCDLCGSFC
jgi:hypothetical protein